MAVRLYVLLVGLAAAGTATALVLAGFKLPPLWVIVSIGLLAAAAERAQVRLTNHIAISISLLPILFVAVVYGPLAGMAVAAIAMLGDFRAPHLRWALYTGAGALNGALAGIVAMHSGALTDSAMGSTFLATALAALSLQVFDLMIVTLTFVVRRTMTVDAVLATALPILPTSVLLNSALVGPLAYAYLEFSPWILPFFLLPALAAQKLFTMYQAQRELARDLSMLNERLERANFSFASALVATLEARDRYTAGHSATVAVYARDIAAHLALTLEEQRLAHLAGMVHDIGKIGVPHGILEKPGPLTLQERRTMEEHSVIGERILANVEAYTEVATIVRHHHERVDGLGYPDTLKKDEIPLISRIICVADAYNAMTSDRPYRDAMPSSVARERLRQAAGSQFDTDVVRAFDEILETATESYTIGTQTNTENEAREHAELAPAITADAA
jgi:putative nucleotidyltransferase with HDIG domain